MEFCVVYGKSGTGKSKYIYDDIKKVSSNKKIFLVVPEQSNLSAEQKLFKELGVNTLMDIEVLTLSRMAIRVLDEVGAKSRKILSDIGKKMIIFDILSKEKNNLKFLGKSDKNIEIVSNIITELKKHNISLEALANINIEEQYTTLKLEDIKKIYGDYQNKISTTFMDENDELTLLYENIGNVDIFKDSIIYFDDFLGFTSQEYKIFDALVKQAAKITVTIPSDSMFITSKETDIFYFNKKFANRLIDIATENSAKIEYVNLEKNYRVNSEDLEYLENAISQNCLKKFSGKSDNIKFIVSENPYIEVENIAKKINELTRKYNYRYRDFIVISSDVAEYKDDIKSIFLKYDIPVFIDEKKELNQNILVKFIVAIIEIFAKNWSFDSVMNYLKIGLLDFSDFQICEFENYCLKWGIKYNKWFTKYEYESQNDKQDEFEDMRLNLIRPLLDLKNKICKNKSVRDWVKDLYEFLIDNKININLDKKIKNIADIEIINEYNTSYKTLVKLFDEIVLIFGDEIFTFDKFKEILQVGVNSSELGKIPATQDGVIFGDISRSRGSDVKIEFLIGVNDGKIPSNNKVEGFLNDDDRQVLTKLGFELAKDSKDNMYEEQFNIYRMLTLPSDKLYITYSLSNKSGESIRPSILIKKINKMFDISQEEIPKYDITNNEVGFDFALELYRKFLDGHDLNIQERNIVNYFKTNNLEKFSLALSGLKYNNVAEDITMENVAKLYGSTLQTSISKLEQYQGCPFSFHMKYGLKLQEKRELEIRSLDTGNFMHEVIDEFFSRIQSSGLVLKELKDEEIDEIVINIINELLKTSKYYIFSSTAKFKILCRRLKKVVLNSIKYIIYTLKNSKFEILGNEIEFSRNSEYKPIEVILDDGKKVELTGKIDRVDIGKLNDKEYVRIIDYKSSIKNLDFNKVVAGLQIQLITYLDDMCVQKAFEPGGVLYMGLIDNIVKASKNLSNEEIEEEIKKNFKMQGIVLADIDVVKMMDTTLNSGYSDIIPVGISKTTGDIVESRSNVVKREDFSNLQMQVRKLIKQISTEILNGNIEIKPYYYKKSTPCEFCKYKEICRFVPGMKGNEYRYIPKSNKQEILDELREEYKNECY